MLKIQKTQNSKEQKGPEKRGQSAMADSKASWGVDPIHANRVHMCERAIREDETPASRRTTPTKKFIKKPPQHVRKTGKRQS